MTFCKLELLWIQFRSICFRTEKEGASYGKFEQQNTACELPLPGTKVEGTSAVLVSIQAPESL